jgi:hypothetical protein
MSGENIPRREEGKKFMGLGPGVFSDVNENRTTLLFVQADFSRSPNGFAQKSM